MLTIEQRIKNLSVPQGPIDMVLDTDAYNEIDDQFAISYAMLSDKTRVKALYSAPFTNERSTGPADGMEKSYQEILKLLDLMGLSCPVFRGSTDYLKDEKTPQISEAAKDLAERAAAYTPENPLYVVSIGAITNVASALLLDPSIADKIVIVWLGGNSLEWHDNHEFNAQQDVAADRVVFLSGAPLVILPCMGVVSAFTTTGPELHEWLDDKNPLCTYLVQHTVEAAESYAKGKVWSRAIWDVTAVGWLKNDHDKFMLSKLIPTPIPQYDHHYSHDPRQPLCLYIYHIWRDALFSDLFKELSQ